MSGELSEQPIGQYIGDSREIKKETLPAVVVDNQVLFVNPEIETPLNLVEGQSTRLGLMLNPKPEREKLRREKMLTFFFGDKEVPDYHLEVKHPHRRSSLLGRAVFRDKQGNLYRDIDLKGTGLISFHGSHAEAIPEEPRRDRDDDLNEVRGLLKLGSAFHDKDMSEAFLKAGIRTDRVIAIIAPKQLIDREGQKISIDEARQRQIVGKNYKPAIEVRAFGTKYRLEDLLWKKENQLYLEDAKALVAQEQGINPKDFSNQDYLDWYSRTLGTQVARMHRHGWYHDYITPHNLTLDCRIVDLDSVGWLKDLTQIDANNKIIKDKNGAGNTLHFFIKEQGGSIIDRQDALRHYQEAYDQEWETKV